MQKTGALLPNPNGHVATGPPMPPYPSATALLAPNPLNPLLAISTSMIPSTVPHPMPSAVHRPTSAQPFQPSQHQHLANVAMSGGLPASAMNAVHPLTTGLGHTNGTTAAAAISVTSSESPGATSVQSNGSSNIWPSPRGDAYDLSSVCLVFHLT